MSTVELSVDQILNSTVDKLKQLAISKNVTFSSTVTQTQLQGLLLAQIKTQ